MNPFERDSRSALAWLRASAFDMLIVAFALAIVLYALGGIPGRPSDLAASAPVDPSGAPANGGVVTLGNDGGPTALFFVDMFNIQGQLHPAGRARPAPTVIAVPQGQTLSFLGWAIDPKTKTAVANVVALVDSTIVFGGTVGLARPDVATYLKYPDAVNCGYYVTIPTTDLARGKHRVRLRVIGADAKTTYSTEREFALVVTAPHARKARPRGYFDSVDGTDVPAATTVSVRGKDAIRIKGWAVADADGGRAIDRLAVVLDGRVVARSVAPISRPDVAQYFGKPDLARSGFDVTVRLAGLASGKHTLRLRLSSAGAPDVDSGAALTIER